MQFVHKTLWSLENTCLLVLFFIALFMLFKKQSLDVGLVGVTKNPKNYKGWL